MKIENELIARALIQKHGAGDVNQWMTGKVMRVYIDDLANDIATLIEELTEQPTESE